MSDITCRVSTWWNYGNRSTAGDSLALPSHPELGEQPHAQEVMKVLGVKYEASEGSPLMDSWAFYGCSEIPNCSEPWLSVHVDGVRYNAEDGQK